MATVLLIRHGQASYGQADYDRLSPRGAEQAKAVGAWLATQKLDAVFAGPHVRQRETAAIAREHARFVEPTELAEFAEYPGFEMVTKLLPRLVAEDTELAQHAGDSARTSKLAGRAFNRILDKWARDEWHHDEVERVGAFTARVRRGLERVIAAAGSGGRVAIVTSAGPIGVAVGAMFGATDHHMVRTSVVVRNASISELKIRTRDFAWHPDQASLVSFNSVAHLPAELITEY